MLNRARRFTPYLRGELAMVADSFDKFEGKKDFGFFIFSFFTVIHLMGIIWK